MATCSWPISAAIARNGYLAQQYITALTVALIMLVPQVALLMPLYATLVGGDLVAKEAEDGTLRMILSRLELLLPRWLARCFVIGGVRVVLRTADLVFISALMQAALALPMGAYFHRATTLALPKRLIQQLGLAKVADKRARSSVGSTNVASADTRATTARRQSAVRVTPPTAPAT